MNKKVFDALTQFTLFATMLEVIRIFYSGNIGFVFLIWNLFLAYIPLYISYFLQKQGTGRHLENVSVFLIWLLILPNAPYLVTDLIHFGIRHDVPRWFDLFLLFTYALCGLLLGVCSMIMMLEYLSKYYSKTIVSMLLPTISIACGYGVYIGRFLRWNSWSIVTHPLKLIEQCMQPIMYPWQHSATWLVTIQIAILMVGSYRVLRELSSSKTSITK